MVCLTPQWSDMGLLTAPPSRRPETRVQFVGDISLLGNVRSGRSVKVTFLQGVFHLINVTGYKEL